nr:hypothetical protein [Paraburkholderia diazotrophica]
MAGDDKLVVAISSHSACASSAPRYPSCGHPARKKSPRFPHAVAGGLPASACCVARVERVEERLALLGQLREACACGAMFQHYQLSFEQRVKLGAIHVELVWRLANQHQGRKFVWTEHFRLP